MCAVSMAHGWMCVGEHECQADSSDGQLVGAGTTQAACYSRAVPHVVLRVGLTVSSRVIVQRLKTQLPDAVLWGTLGRSGVVR